MNNTDARATVEQADWKLESSVHQWVGRTKAMGERSEAGDVDAQPPKQD